ncbi:hypothetical protein ERD95_06130 [Enterobacteriaceae bacterium ML5]|nr:hypothetical protein ERD95_06130 [Enterobacteriaceae bacterium ML5]
MNTLQYNFYLDKTTFIPEIPMKEEEYRAAAEKMLVRMAQVSGRDIEDLRKNARVMTPAGELFFSTGYQINPETGDRSKPECVGLSVDCKKWKYLKTK